jgi:1,4-alpha-glucan branching enzyme
VAQFLKLCNPAQTIARKIFMPATQLNISPGTPLGANLIGNGCSFRLWAPRASQVHIVGDFNNWTVSDASLLVKDGNGFWGGFIPAAGEGQNYKFWVVGPTGLHGHKRDPYARELNELNWNCVIRQPSSYPWHDQGYHPPAFEELIIYQFHVGTFYAVDSHGQDTRHSRGARFLDVLDRVEYLADLGVSAVQPLPIVEFATRFSQGYNGVDYFSPESSYGIGTKDLPRYLATANRLLAARAKPPISLRHLEGEANQLRAVVDILHVYGIAVIFDVVYNHAGGDFGDESLYFLDRMPPGNNNDSLYFTDKDWAGGLVFAYWNQTVRQFLIDNAMSFVQEYHVDGFRYDEVSVIDRFGGRSFCQDLSQTIRYAAPTAVQIAESWNSQREWATKPPSLGGAGFDLVWDDKLRDALRGVLAQAAGGRDSPLSWSGTAEAIGSTPSFDYSWRAVAMLENHDLLLESHSPQDKKPRIPAAADPSNARSWYARSRARVAAGLLLTAPGVPMLFMGQEFLEDKYWSDSTDAANLLIWWDGLGTDRAMSDYLRFMHELIAARRGLAALRRGAVNVFHAWNGTRVFAFHRWLEHLGQDVVVIASLNETTQHNYAIGFPLPGRWFERFNSDVYDNWVNPMVAGNGGSVLAHDGGLHGLPAHAEITIPANSILIFTKAD